LVPNLAGVRAGSILFTEEVSYLPRSSTIDLSIQQTEVEGPKIAVRLRLLWSYLSPLLLLLKRSLYGFKLRLDRKVRIEHRPQVTKSGRLWPNVEVLVEPQNSAVSDGEA